MAIIGFVLGMILCGAAGYVAGSISWQALVAVLIAEVGVGLVNATSRTF